MKVKRFKNLWTMGLILCAVILLAVYILKIFFPQFVIEVSHIESITRIGHFIDNNKWAWYLASISLSFFVYYFHCCACCKKKFLNKKEVLIVIITILLLLVIKEFFAFLYTPINICTIIALPALFKAELKSSSIVFCSVTILQALTIEIRNISTMIIDYNFATLLILMIDIYIVQIFLYLSFNYKNKEE